MKRNIVYSFAFLIVLALVYLYYEKGRYVNLALVSSAADDNHGIQSLSIAEGWQIDFFAHPSLGLKSPRQLAFGDGWVFVGSRSGSVYALKDANQDGSAEQVRIVAEGLKVPHGVAFHDGNLYIGAVENVYVADNVAQQLADSDGTVQLKPVISGLLDSTHHGTRHLAVGPDGMLYVSLGTPCNVCIPPDLELSGVIRKYPLNGGESEAVARGVRNSVGFDFHPQTGELWFTDNGRDWLGDELPQDELNRVRTPGAHFGFPFCHQGDLPDPEFGKGTKCSDYEPPALKTGPHVANLGMRFSPSGDEVYIALHGSWNRSEKSGYAVYRAKVDGDGVVTDYVPFVHGWLLPDEGVLGRPVDIIWNDDDSGGGESLLISDDFAHAIYRVWRTS